MSSKVSDKMSQQKKWEQYAAPSGNIGLYNDIQSLPPSYNEVIADYHEPIASPSSQTPNPEYEADEEFNLGSPSSQSQSIPWKYPKQYKCKLCKNTGCIGELKCEKCWKKFKTSQNINGFGQKVFDAGNAISPPIAYRVRGALGLPLSMVQGMLFETPNPNSVEGNAELFAVANENSEHLPWSYPAGYWCRRCKNTGYKTNGTHRRCRLCWRNFHH
ncbi:hypothetical protein TBLA_0C05890 [Henningerozyma blattae CBS 6284]|uniref:Uncharacterized protein n=1 Tax=Henningerozyma blattae (strain ATCC 34711 / CBS 6284 / DSM 70876 / NBRC 10599 / NRRL Y-10934 / UCD 77-7) TaxID=1071380 RepID=I2H1Y4_HENB6|nr:hypothetical protein TBLA_0C05890 [Tetrapisispora blattae CBS 6284]CCH60386.1 hypothetical protein TBLA_0C05890 [Tetrapisispora blattae CBS 6284]